MAGPQAAVTREMLAEARAIAEEGRQSHVTWAEHLEGHEGGAPCARCTADVTAATGDAAHDRDWVRKYDALLAVIAYVEGLQPDTAYMPVPRCESCAYWGPFTDVEGRHECLMARESKAVGPAYEELMVAPGFGCVEWKARDAAG